jgi:hypothetical protein
MAENTSTVRIGDREYPFVQVSLFTIKKHLEFMKAQARMVDEGKSPGALVSLEQLMEMGEIIHECIVEASPEVTLDEVLKGIHQATVYEQYGVVMNGSGFVPAGEAKAGVAA